MSSYNAFRSDDTTTGPQHDTAAYDASAQEPFAYPALRERHEDKIRPFDHTALLGRKRQYVRHVLGRIAQAANQH